MKTIIFLLITFQVFSQGSDLGYKPIPKGECKTDHTCRMDYKYDSFENVMTYKVGFYETRLAQRGLSYVIFRNVDAAGNQKIQLLFFAVKEGCRTSKSYVHIQFKNGEKLKLLTATNDIECGTSALYVDISDHLDLLMKEPMEKIRIAIEFEDDFDVTEKGQKKFFSNLECITKQNIKI